MIPRMVAASALGLLWIAPALAQNPGLTGTGGGPASTITAPHTNALGVTKPPGSGVGPETPAVREQRSDIERKDDKILKGICIGCGVK